MTKRPAAGAFMAVLLLVLAGCGTYRLPAPESLATTHTRVTSPPPRPPASATTSPTPTPSPTTRSPRQVRAAVNAKVAKIAAREPDHSVSVAAVNTTTGTRYEYGPDGGMWTASVYKLLVLETLLMQRQRAGGSLSSGEVATATRMIENSDNTAGYQLFLDAGGNSGLAEGARRLGMKHTVIGRTDPTFTTTSARECLRMLEALVRDGPLDADSRSFVLGLMRNVEADQRWGVGVIADPHTRFANKNGWLSVENNGPGESDNGRWAVNSVGIVTVGGDRVLMAVMTQHQPSFDAGVRLVQHLARTVAPLMR